MTLTEQVAKRIIKKLLNGDDYRIEIVTLINADFLQFSIDFFKKVVEAKISNQELTTDWYKFVFLNSELDKTDIAINSGLNMKTIGNMFHTTKKDVVIDASNEHYDSLYAAIQALIENEDELDLILTIKLNGVSVDLNLSESLIVVNALAVKRAALRGGLWSTAGKRVEKPLMHTLCELYSVPRSNFKFHIKGIDTEKSFQREIDFFLVNDEKNYKCEVKLMGKGNPESADAVIARDSRIFVADKLSDTNKAQLETLNVEWVELRDKIGFRKFKSVLENLQISHQELNESDLDQQITSIFEKIFS